MPRLHLVTSIHDLDVHRSVDGLGENRPTERKQLIFTQLRQHQSHIHSHLLEPDTATAPSLSLAQCVHDPQYLSFLETAWDRWHTLVQSKTADLYMSENGTRAGGDTSLFMPGQIAPRADTGVNGHSHPLSRPGDSVHSQICYYALDRFTPIKANLLMDLYNDLRVVQHSVNILIDSKKRASTCEPVTVYALTTNPGHHASRSTFGGFCYVNNACVAASLLLQSRQFKRIGLLDIDYHAGNGSESIFYSSDSVSLVSIHADPNIDYPFNMGWQDNTGSHEGTGYTCNIPLPAHTDWSQYKPHLAAALQRFRSQGVDCIVVSLGVDTLQGDPECAPLGGFSLQVDDYTEQGQMLRATGLPLLFVSEGGYLLAKVPLAVRNTVLPDYQ